MSRTKQSQIAQAEPWRRRLYLPAYTVQDAARYAGISAQTVAYWHYRVGSLGPALPGKERGKPLSYLQLLEVAMVATFRRIGLSLQRIRRAREYAAQMFNSEFPFAELRFKTDGFHLLMDLQANEPDAELGRLVVADAHGQMAWQKLVAERFLEFDYEHDLALRWHVAGPGSPVLIDPRISFGAPVVRGIPTWVIKGRWNAGESVDDIEKDFNLEKVEVVQALNFERIQLAA